MRGKQIRHQREFFLNFCHKVNLTVYSAVTTFKLNVTTSTGSLQIPRIANAITLGGRESKVIVTDYTFGASSKALYATAPVFFAGTIGGRDILFLYGNSTQEHEVSLKTTGTPTKLTQSSSPQIKKTQDSTFTTITILSGVKGLTTLYDSDTQLILYADTDTATTFWAPTIAGAANDPFRNFWGLGTNETVLVGGPYLVRNASLSLGGQQLSLTGDLKEGVLLTVIGPKTLRRVTWNGKPVTPDVSISLPSANGGSIIGRLRLHNEVSGMKIPKLTGWKFKDSLPEVNDPNFSDGNWTLANKTTTNIPWKPFYGDGRVLYGCDYGL